MNKAINFVMWLAFKYPKMYHKLYAKFLDDMKAETKGGNEHGQI